MSVLFHQDRKQSFEGKTTSDFSVFFSLVFFFVYSIPITVLSAIAIIGLIYRSDKKRLFMTVDSDGLAGVYGHNLLVLYSIEMNDQGFLKKMS